MDWDQNYSRKEIKSFRHSFVRASLLLLLQAFYCYYAEKFFHTNFCILLMGTSDFDIAWQTVAHTHIIVRLLYLRVEKFSANDLVFSKANCDSKMKPAHLYAFHYFVHSKSLRAQKNLMSVLPVMSIMKFPNYSD